MLQVCFCRCPQEAGGGGEEVQGEGVALPCHGRAPGGGGGGLGERLGPWLSWGDIMDRPTQDCVGIQ